LYLETHAGSGAYDLGDPAGGNRGPRAGLADVLGYTKGETEIAQYAQAVQQWRTGARNGQAYPGSPLLAAGALRTQDRALLAEVQPPEAHALERALLSVAKVRVEIGDGYDLLRAHLPPAERRGVVLIDPPYEETSRDFERAATATAEALAKFASCVVLLWYPI
jgi:23S rRNA (adenine2030-N6)-methyltransferase